MLHFVSDFEKVLHHEVHMESMRSSQGVHQESTEYMESTAMHMWKSVTYSLLGRFMHSFSPSVYVHDRYGTDTLNIKSMMGYWKINSYFVWTIFKTCGDVCHLQVIQMGNYLPQSVIVVWEAAIPYWRVTHPNVPDPDMFIFDAKYYYSNLGCSYQFNTTSSLKADKGPLSCWTIK